MVEQPSLDKLIGQIAVLTENARRRAESESEFHRIISALFNRLKDEALSPAYHHLARHLPGFRSTYNSDQFALGSLVPRHGLLAQLGWADHISSPPGLPHVIVSVAVAVRVINRIHAEVVGILRVQRPHPVVSDNSDIFQSTIEVMPGGATVSNAVTVLQHGLMEATTQGP